MPFSWQQKFVASAVALLVMVLETSNSFNSTELLPSGFRKGRWGIFFTYEPVCTLACKRNGKFSGRMYGGVCRCYCPRLEQDPCIATSYPSCDRFCRQNNYHLGGDCLDEKNCYCYCTVRQRQSPNGTTTTAAPPCGPEAATTPSPSAPPAAPAPIENSPAPGSLGSVGTSGTSGTSSFHKTAKHRNRHPRPGN